MSDEEELNEELESGSRLARELVEHVVLGMGAGASQLPVPLGGKLYHVIVREAESMAFEGRSES